MPKFKDLLYVIIQAVLMIIFFIDASWFSIDLIQHFIWLYVAGLGVVMMLVALLQLNTNLSPFPTPLSNAQLVTSGVFKISRHPIYTGILIFMFSISLWLGDGYKLSISLLTLTVFYFKSSYEESLLEATFKDYKIYKRKTGRFLPKFQLLK